MGAGQTVIVLPSPFTATMLSRQYGLYENELHLLWRAVAVFMGMYSLSNGHLVCSAAVLSATLAAVWCG